MAIQNTNADADKKATVNIVDGIIKSVDPDPIKMGTNQNQIIEWSIASTDPDAKNYTFSNNGIEIKPGTDPGGQFTLRATGNAKKFRLHDKNSNKQRYGYTVNVMNGTTPLRPLDPIIGNGE
jgi:hypothetical protein